jgi:ATP-dependent RNA helicase RhlE
MRPVRFTDFAFSEALQAGIAAREHITPTPIQERMMGAALEGRDVLGSAQTGSGKTAAYVLPLLDRLAEHTGLHTLVVVPTRELAYQVEEEVASYGRNLPIRTAVIVGGAAMREQITRIRDGAQIVVGTPGRLLDLQGRRVLDLSQVQVLVLDEVDRMLDMGFLPDMQRIVRYLPGHRQSLFFSATMPSAVAPLAAQLLEHPVEVTADPPATTVPTVTQNVHVVMDGRKLDALETLLREPGAGRVLVFGRTKRSVDDIYSQLRRRGFGVEMLHGDRSLDQRLEALERFKTGEAPILIATDVAARGLDILDVTHVVNFDVPDAREDYIHRIGRTARAQKDGIAITLVAPDELLAMRRLQAALRQKLNWNYIDAAPVTAAPAGGLPGERLSGRLTQQAGLAAENRSQPLDLAEERRSPDRRPARTGSRRW